MNETLVERVAQALCEAYGNEWDETPATGSGLHSHHPLLPARDDWYKMARAAIAAITGG